MSSAGPSRPRVITLTADQLLGTSLTPARTPKPPKSTSNGTRVLTIEDLLGPGLTVARPAHRPHAPKPTTRASPRPTSRSFSSTRSTTSSPNPRLVRVTADEVLRTGIPVRTLQAVKARSGQARILTAEELLASGSSLSSGQRPTQTGTSSRATASGQHAGPSGTSRAARSAGSSAAQAVGSSSAATSTYPETRPATASASSANGSGNTRSAASQSRHSRNVQPRRSASLGSMRTLPIYTQEPGESEVVIDRGATELEDEDAMPTTVISPVEENDRTPELVATSDVAAVSPSCSGSPTQTTRPSLSRHLSQSDGASSPISSSLPLPSHLPPWVAVYGEAAPSYEMAMSTPNLHGFPVCMDLTSVSLPTSPILELASQSPASAGPTPRTPSPVNVSTATSRPAIRVLVQPAPDAPSSSALPPQSPRGPCSLSPTLSSGPATPSSGEHHSGSGSGADTPRRRFGFMALFHSRSSSRLRSHSQSERSERGERTHTRTGSASATPSPRRVASPELLAPAPTRPSGSGGLQRLDASADEGLEHD